MDEPRTDPSAIQVRIQFKRCLAGRPSEIGLRVADIDETEEPVGFRIAPIKLRCPESGFQRERARFGLGYARNVPENCFVVNQPESRSCRVAIPDVIGKFVLRHDPSYIRQQIIQ